MADLEKIVKILFQGDDQVSASMNGIAGNMSDFGSIATSAAEPWAAVADNILMADAALAALAVGGLAYAFNASKNFETATIELNKVMGDNPEGVRLAAAAATELSNQYGIAATNVLSSTAEFKQAGFTVEEAMQLTKNAMDLVIAGGIESSQASSLLVATLKGFGEPASEAARLLDILNETSNNYATNVEELASGMAKLSPIANQMGFSFEETAGLLTPVIEVFGSGDEAARGFRTGLLNLTSDMPRVTTALTALGISQTDVNGQMRSGRDIFYEVQGAFTSLTDTEKIYYTQQLAGKDQSAKMAIAFDSLNYSLAVTEGAMGSAGSAIKEVAVFLESSEVSVDRFIQGFQNLSIAVGDQFREAAREAVNGGTAIENALENMIKDGTFDEIFNKIGQFANTLGDDLKLIAENLPEAMGDVDFSDLLGAFDTLGDSLQTALSDIWGDLDLTTPEGLTNAIQKVVDSFSALINTSAGIVDGMRPMFIAIGTAIDEFNNLDGDTQQLSGTFLGVAKTIKTFADNLDLLKPALLVMSGASMVSAVANIGQLGVAAISTNASMAALALNPAWALLSSAAVGVGIGTSLRSLFPVIDEVTQKFWRMVDSVINFTGQQGNVNLEPSLKSTGDAADTAARQIGGVTDAVNTIPGETESRITINGVEYSLDQVRAMQINLENMPAEKQVDVDVETTQARADVESFEGYVIETLEDGTISISSAPDTQSVDDTAAAIQESLDPLKVLEIQTELDIAQLEAATTMFGDAMSVMNTQIEWDAQIDIAEIEADAQKVEAAFESIGVTVSAVSDVVATMFTGLSDYDGSHFYELYDVMQDEMDMQRDLIAAQVRLIDAQIASMDRGDPIWTISGENMSDAAQGFMYAIMKEIQLTNFNDGGTSLMGVS